MTTYLPIKLDQRLLSMVQYLVQIRFWDGALEEDRDLALLGDHDDRVGLVVADQIVQRGSEVADSWGK